MKILNNKKTAIAIILMLTFVTLFAGISIGEAVTIVDTYSYITVNPNPIGAGQTAFVTFWLDQVSPTASAAAGDRWQGVTVTITKPNGNIETTEEYSLDAVSSGWMTYTPTEVGVYTFQMHFPGQDIVGFGGGFFPQQWNHTYLPSDSPVVTLDVQDEQIGYWDGQALPTNYWERPINAEFHGWGAISGAWLASGSAGPHGPRTYGPSGNYNPYTEGPESSHIAWTKELDFGGIVGGQFGDTPYYPGESYERKFQPIIIMNGRLYYNNRLGASSWQGFTCVDLRTGEVLWSKDEGTLTCGQLLNMQTPNQHGVIPYLWSASGSTWKMYDAFNGNWILDIANVSSGTMVVGDIGELLVYTLNGAGGTLSLWNSTLAIQPDIDTAWSWRPPAGATVDGNNGQQWTVDVPSIPGAGINKVEDGIVYVTVGVFFGALNTLAGFDANTGATLWGPVSIERGTTPAGTMYEISGNYYAEYVRETMQWYGYNVRTGAQIWGPTPAYTNAWGFYQTYCDSMVADGKLIAAAYDGMVHCYDIATGTHLWDHFTGSAGFETFYGNWPYKDAALSVAGGPMGGGKVFAINNEHSPSTPFYRGDSIFGIDLEDGTGLWNITFMGVAPFVAEGYVVAFNYLDGRIYCFGMSESETTVTAAPKTSAKGTSVMIEGSVLDMASGNPGIPCVSADSMSEWMEYQYMQMDIPASVNGVTVTLDAIGPNDQFFSIGTATTDLAGNFGTSWTPTVEGDYQILASFGGTESYGSSFATTYVTVGPEAEEFPTIPTCPDAPTAEEVAQKVLDNLPDDPSAEDIAQETVNQLVAASEETETEPAAYTTIDLVIIAAVAVVAALVVYNIYTVRKRK